MDLISELPEAVLHRILCSLPSRDLARTSVLSKKWNTISSSCPTVSLIQNHFNNSIDGFSDFMRLSLQNFVTRNLGLTRFKLYITTYDHEALSGIVDQWINFVAKTRVEEIYIEISKIVNAELGTDQFVCYNLPAGFFPLSSKTLTTLSLNGCGLLNYYCSGANLIIALPNLQNLALQSMDLDDTFIHNLLSCCTLLEQISISLCHALKTLEISSRLQRLRTLVVERCDNLGKIVVATPSLESFRTFGDFFGDSKRCEMINLDAASDSLKSLSLSYVVAATSGWLQSQISKFISLEHLYLNNIKNLETIKISNPKLSKLAIFHCYRLGAATEIDAPNLHEVEYTDNMLPFYSIRSTNLGKATFRFSLGDDYENVWFDKLEQLYQTTSRIGDFKVAVLYYVDGKPRIITTELSDEMIAVLDEMEDPGIEVEISSKSSPEWFDRLLSGCPLEKLYVGRHDYESFDFINALYVEVLSKRAKAEASQKANGSMTKCKHFYMEDVEIGSINWAEEEQNEDENIGNWISLLKAYKDACYNITAVDMKWNRREGSICFEEGCRQCRV